MAGFHARLLDFALVVLLAATLAGCGHPSAPALSTFTVPAGDSVEVGATPALALSRTGDLLVYVGRHGNGTRLYLQAISGGQPRALAGTEGAANPFFSPDGGWLGFFADGKLKKLLLEDRNAIPIVVCDASGPRGASWGEDGRIVFAVVGRLELLRVSAEGGEPQPVTRPTDQADFGHRWPQLLPDGKTALFVMDTGAGFDNGRIATLSLETGEIRPLIEGGTFPHYVAGHLVYSRDNTILAARFDITSLTVIQPPATALSNVAMHPFFGVANFSVANNGSLAYISRDLPEAQRSLVWVDRKGMARPVTPVKHAYGLPRLSPDGTKVAFTIEKPTWEVWTYDLKTDRSTRLSEPGVDADSPHWSRDGRDVTFASKASGSFNVFGRAADGSGPQEQLLKSRFWDFPSAWSPDGRALTFTRYYPPPSGSGWDVWVLEPGRGARPWISEAGNQGSGAGFSPDGRWMAYIANYSGRSEVYIQPYPGPGARRRVSSAGGRQAVWSRDGRELFYREGQKLMSISIRTTPTFSIGPPTALFEGPYVFGDAGGPYYDVAPDGQTFIMVLSEIEPEQLEIRVVPDWVQHLPK